MSAPVNSLQSQLFSERDHQVSPHNYRQNHPLSNTSSREVQICSNPLELCLNKIFPSNCLCFLLVILAALRYGYAISQGRVKFPTGGISMGDLCFPCMSPRAPDCRRNQGQADPVKCRSRRLESGWERIRLTMQIHCVHSDICWLDFGQMLRNTLLLVSHFPPPKPA